MVGGGFGFYLGGGVHITWLVVVMRGVINMGPSSYFSPLTIIENAGHVYTLCNIMTHLELIH